MNAMNEMYAPRTHRRADETHNLIENQSITTIPRVFEIFTRRGIEANRRKWKNDLTNTIQRSIALAYTISRETSWRNLVFTRVWRHKFQTTSFETK